MAASVLLSRLDYEFQQPALLRQALTHRSHSANHNERLEFLGDAVLNCTIAALLYERFPRLPEGDLSRLRANLVNQETLSRVAASLELGDALHLGEGELKSGGFRRPSILADALEAVFGAIFVDGGFAPAAHAIAQTYAALLDEIVPERSGKDPKTLLQEYLQGHRKALPQYNVVSVRGEAHEQQFDVECIIAELDVRTTGVGSSRRSAEQTAAQLAYEQVTKR